MPKSFKLLIINYSNNITHMLNLCKNSLLVVLALLQFIAPLAHAHTGNSHVHGGIHMPGLESYFDNQDATSLSNVNMEWQCEGLLILVDAGIKHPLEMAVKNTASQEYTPSQGVIPAQTLAKMGQNFFPHDIAVRPPNKFPPPQSPRAPPLPAINLTS